jgi:ADP-ribose pyrophosphatase YjhB (NUDIX family)
MQVENFNIRVYGILEHPNGGYLLTNETRGGVNMTKFVGGGLEYGEGTKDCLEREFMEEMNLKIEVLDLFYLTDFMQVSAFNPKDQLISIYYNVSTNDWSQVEKSIERSNDSSQSFEWVKRKDLNVENITFPIDKIVVGMIINHLGCL